MRRHYRREVLSPQLIKRILTYGILLLLLAAAESGFFARLRYLPTAPDLILGVVVAVTLLDSQKAGAIVGVVGGFFSDALGGVGISLSPILYLLVALVVGSLATKMMSSFPSFSLLMLPALACRGLFTVGQAMLLWQKGPFLDVLRYLMLPELIVTAVFCLPMYWVIKGSMLIFRSARDHTLR